MTNIEDKLGDFGISLSTHGANIGLSKFQGFGEFGNYNNHKQRSGISRGWYKAQEFISGMHNRYFNKEEFNKKREFVKAADEKELQELMNSQIYKIYVHPKPIQVIATPELFYKSFEEMVEPERVERKGLFGLKKVKIPARYEKRKEPAKLSECLESYTKDEDAYVLSGGVPYIMGWAYDKRGGGYFVLNFILSKEGAESFYKEIEKNPKVFSEIGERLFPEQFEALQTGIPIHEIPIYLLNSEEVKNVNPKRLDEYLKKVR